jgi:hypothetical protein
VAEPCRDRMVKEGIDLVDGLMLDDHACAMA